MATVLRVHESNPELRHIRRAASILAEGGIVLAPTETGYCFLGDAQKESTSARFLTIRQAHPKHKPFSLLCKSLTQVSEIAILNTVVYRVAKRALPGPYTFVLECNRGTPKPAAGPKRKTVGVRMSSHPVTKALVELFGHPILVTSVTDAEELEHGLYYEGEAEQQRDSWWTSVESICERYGKQFELALENDQPVRLRVSTVVDFTQNPPCIIRDGGWDTEPLGL